jgi:hypothetical protein
MGFAGGSGESAVLDFIHYPLIANFDCCPRIFARFAYTFCNRPKCAFLPPPSVARPIESTVYALALHRVPALFLQIATEFATIASMLSPSQPIQPGAENKLAALRRLDKSRAWNSLDDQLYCTGCKTVISGRQIEVVGGTNGLRALHLKCSTPGCLSTPADWILPVKSETVREIDFLFRDDGA